MQENKSFENRVEASIEGVAVGRHRAPEQPTGRRRAYIASVAVALVGFGLAGVSAATSGGDRHGRLADSAAVASDERSRAEAAERADRSTREGPDPATSVPAPDSLPADLSPADAPAADAPPADSSSADAVTGSAASAPTEQGKEAASTGPTSKPDWVSPMPGAGTTSCYGPRWGTLHAGIDLAMPENTPIQAAGAGTVVTAGWAYTGYGISVVIDHGNGYLTHYAHQNKTNVRVGQQVSAGDLIGWEGSTGDSTGPHLHFEVHNGLWNQINPGPWMKDRGVDLGC